MYLKKALRGTILVFVLSLVGGLFGYLMRFFLARKLTVEEFGLFYSVITVFLFIIYLLDFGLGQAVSRKIVEFTVHNEHRRINNLVMSIATVQIGISVFFGLLIIIFRRFLSERYFHADASVLLVLGVFWILFIPISTIYSNIFSGFQRPEYSYILETSKSILLFGFSVLFVYLGYAVLSPALAYVSASLLLVIIFYFFAKRMYPGLSMIRFSFDRNTVFKTFHFGLMIGASNFIYLIMLQIDTLLITYFMTSSDVGLYQVAITISYLLLYLTGALSAVLYPLISNLLFMKEYDRIIEAIRLVYKYLLVVLIPVVVIIASFAKNIIFIFFTEKYLAASIPLSILVVFTIFCSIMLINTMILTALGETHKVLWSVVIAALLNFVLNFITIPLFGLIGAAISTLFSFIVAAVLSSYQLKRCINITFPIKDWLKLLFISAILIIETRYLIRFIVYAVFVKIILIVLLVILSYFILLFAFRILDLKETRYLLRTFLGR